MAAEGLVLATGAVAFAGNFKEAGGFPDNGYGIIASTIALTFIASIASRGSFARPVTALAALMLLGAAYRYAVPLIVSQKRTD